MSQTALAMMLLATAPAEAAPPPPASVEAVVGETPVDAPKPDLPSPPEAAPEPDVSGEIVVSATQEAPKEDPLEQANLQSYEAVQAVDKAIVAPVAMGYKKAVPKPVRDGIVNFINNLDEPVVALNYLLQLKPGKAAETLGRFAINSTLGVGGLVDVAKKKPFNLPRRYNGFAYTLGYYGVGPGPYLFLPGFGPTTVRDLAGRIIDFSIVPRVVGPPLSKPEVGLAKATLDVLGDRVADDTRIRALRDDSDDGYGAIRKAYLDRRQAEIDALRGPGKSAGEVASPSPATPEPAAPIETAP